MSTGWEREKGEARRHREPLTSLDENEPVRPQSLSSTSRSRALALAHLVTGVLKLSYNTVLAVCCKAGSRAAVDQGEHGGGSTGRSREGEGTSMAAAAVVDPCWLRPRTLVSPLAGVSDPATGPETDVERAGEEPPWGRGGRAAGGRGAGEPPSREDAGSEGEEEPLRDHRKEASPTHTLLRDGADADECERGRRCRMQPPPLPGVPDPTVGLETEVERAGGEPSGDERETLGDVETRERVVRRRRWRLGSGDGGGRRSGRGGGGGTRGAGRRREKGRERVRVGTDRLRLFGWSCRTSL
jgi:hypothetical protein